MFLYSVIIYRIIKLLKEISNNPAMKSSFLFFH